MWRACDGINRHPKSDDLGTLGLTVSMTFANMWDPGGTMPAGLLAGYPSGLRERIANP